MHGTVTALFRFATGDARDLPRGYASWLDASPVPQLTRRRRREVKEVTILPADELEQLERLRRLQADEELLLALQLEQFTGRLWERFSRELTRYGLGVLRVLRDELASVDDEARL